MGETTTTLRDLIEAAPAETLTFVVLIGVGVALLVTRRPRRKADREMADD